VDQEYERMIQSLGPELEILFDRSGGEMTGHANPRVIEGILQVREGKAEIEPGYDGLYGKVKIFREGANSAGSRAVPTAAQMDLFS
jgi:PHP family Zn ribbon phosphoesterase